MILFLTNNTNTIPFVEWLRKEKEPVEVYGEKLVDNIDADFIVSFNYKYIIPDIIIKRYSNKIINCHCGYLPWNRGAYPNLWSILEDTPKGFTIHFVDKTIDTGDIIFQLEIFFDGDQTLRSTYDYLIEQMIGLLKYHWHYLRKSINLQRFKQNGKGTYHTLKDFDSVKHVLTNGWDTKIYEAKENYEKSVRALAY